MQHHTIRRVTAGSLALTFAAGLLALQGSVSVQPTSARLDPPMKKPNIVVLMTDDMRADDIRFMPTVNKVLGDRGLTFRNSFSPYPLCCPARTSFLTGQAAHNHKVLDNHAPWGFQALDDRKTVATSLQAAGYNTAMVGKYLNMYGIARSKVTGKPSLHYVPPGWTDWYAGLQVPASSGFQGTVYNYYNTPFNINGAVTNRYSGQYQTDVIGRFSRKLAGKYSPSTKPFFLWLTPLAPHTGGPRDSDDNMGVGRTGRGEFVTPSRPQWVRGMFDKRVKHSPGLPKSGGPSEPDISDKPRYMRKRPDLSKAERRAETIHTRQRGEALLVLDRQFARLVATLKKSGEYADTVFVFTSDNGYLLGEHRMRAGKTNAFEPSIRVPLLIAGPGVPHGVRYDPATTYDLTATILDLAGADAPHPADGTSLVPLFSGDQGWTTPVITEGIVGSQRYKRNPLRAKRGFTDARSEIGIRTGRWKLVRYGTGEMELYDLETDPAELNSLIGQQAYAGIGAQLLNLWWQYKDCKAAACRAALPADLQLDPEANAASSLQQNEGIERRQGVGLWPASF